MKKRLLTAIVILLSFTFNWVNANPVSTDKASKVAKTLLNALGCDSKATVTQVASPFEELYIFTVNGGKGFIILSADDNSEPVLGYSLENSLDPDNLPDNFRSWLNLYAMNIRLNSRHHWGGETIQMQRKWNRLAQGDTDAIRSNEPKLVIPMMLQTQWNQSPYYNKFCPFDSTANKRAVSGCTATATAQIMKYFNHPAEGYGRGSFVHKDYGELTADYGVYQWDSMPEKLYASSSEGAIDAVATLIYHCGVAVHMNYNPEGSGGKTAAYGYGGDAASENALKYNFKYSPYVWTAFRCDYNDKDWKELMLEELKNDRPILYAGYDEKQGGHAFVVNGYKSFDGTFYINWGWGGSADGFFLITSLNPGGYNFNLFATATIGITPFHEFGGSTVVNTGAEGILGASSADGNVTGGGTYSFGDTITLTATATNEHTRFIQWSDGCRYNPRSTVSTGGTLNLAAQFAPLQSSDTLRYFTTDNAMNRAANIPEGLATDSVWGIKVPASAIKNGCTLNAIRLMGRKQANHTLTIYSGNQNPDEVIYEDTFFDSLDYDFTFHTHHLSAPIALDGTKSLWIKLKCTEVDTPGVFSIWGGNPDGMLVGDNLEPRTDWKFSWMIEPLFNGNVGITNPNLSPLNSQLTVFPNPASSQIRVRLNENESEVEIALMDLSGRIWKSITSREGTSTTISVADMPKGIYVVRAKSPITTRMARIVIQ